MHLINDPAEEIKNIFFYMFLNYHNQFFFGATFLGSSKKAVISSFVKKKN